MNMLLLLIHALILNVIELNRNDKYLKALGPKLVIIVIIVELVLWSFSDSVKISHNLTVYMISDERS